MVRFLVEANIASSIKTCDNLVTPFGMLASVSISVAQAGAVFETGYGAGPDKWASVWLLTRFVDGASVEVHDEANIDLTGPVGRIPFDLE